MSATHRVRLRAKENPSVSQGVFGFRLCGHTRFRTWDPRRVKANRNCLARFSASFLVAGRVLSARYAQSRGDTCAGVRAFCFVSPDSAHAQRTERAP